MPVVRMPGGATAVLCTRGAPRPLRCWECGKPAEHLCDGPGAKGKTCDRAMCNEHRTRVGPGRDLCSTHLQWEASRRG